MSMSAQLGTFWFYRNQFPETSKNDDKFPLKMLEVPR